MPSRCRMISASGFSHPLLSFPTDLMLQLSNLTKNYGSKAVVSDLSLTLEKGEIVGLLGPNGAGKSTTMKMITGYLPATTGTITLAGIDVLASPTAAQEKIGYLPETNPLYSEWTVREFLTFAARSRRLREPVEAVGKALDACGLTEVHHQRIETLSKGYRQRTGFAQAILHDPPVLVLDEPTDGLDPTQKNLLQDFIRSISPEKAILISTHILPEAEALCHRVAVIKKGRLTHEGPAENLVNHFEA